MKREVSGVGRLCRATAARAAQPHCTGGRRELATATDATHHVGRQRIAQPTSRLRATRNAESYRVSSGFELANSPSFAAPFKSAITRYVRPSRGASEDSGVTANVDVSYTAPTQTQLRAMVDRELRHSYDPQAPQYRQQAWHGVLTQRVFGRWDIQLSGGRAQQHHFAIAAAAARIDRLDRVGGGIGFELARQLRAGLDINSVTRASELPGQSYSGLVGGMSFTYGY